MTVRPDAEDVHAQPHAPERLVVFGGGCFRPELASDAALSNTVSRAVHRRLGFDETERVIFFRRGLSEDSR